MVVGLGETMGDGHGAKEGEVAGLALAGMEAQMEDAAGGVIDGAQECQLRAAAFQPIMQAGIDLDQQALCGAASALASLDCRRGVARRAHAMLLEEAVEGGTPDLDAFMRPEHLLEVADAEVRVLAAFPGQGEDALHGLGRGLEDGSLPRIAVNDTDGAFLVEAPDDVVDLATGDRQHVCCLLL